jgi:hypothetical protein
MKRFATICAAAAIILAASDLASAAVVTLLFDANDIFNYATTDDTTLNQQGTARRVWTGGQTLPTGRSYRTYNDAGRDPGATAAQDLQSVADIVGWTGASAGYEGVSYVQLWLRGGNDAWGEKVKVKSGTLTASMNGEYDWTANVDAYGTPTFNTILGGPGHQNAISPTFNTAKNLWSVTGDLYVDNDGDGVYDTGEDLVGGNQYTIWFNATTNNWPWRDDYNQTTDLWQDPWPQIQGTILATATPEPATIVVWSLLGVGSWLGTRVWRRRNPVGRSA